MSPWGRRPLSAAQISYAALDAHVLLALARALAEKGNITGACAYHFMLPVSICPLRQDSNHLLYGTYDVSVVLQCSRQGSLLAHAHAIQPKRAKSKADKPKHGAPPGESTQPAAAVPTEAVKEDKLTFKRKKPMGKMATASSQQQLDGEELQAVAQDVPLMDDAEEDSAHKQRKKSPKKKDKHFKNNLKSLFIDSSK